LKACGVRDALRARGSVGEGARRYDKPTTLSMKTLNTRNPTAAANTMMVWRSSIGRTLAAIPCRNNGLAMNWFDVR
jgi:hypothetical protein